MNKFFTKLVCMALFVALCFGSLSALWAQELIPVKAASALFDGQMIKEKGTMTKSSLYTPNDGSGMLSHMSGRGNAKNADWLTWINDATTGVGLNGYTLGFFSRFATGDLTSYAGQYLTKVRYCPLSFSSPNPVTSFGDYPHIQVWVGGTYDGTNFTGGTMVADVVAEDFTFNFDNFVNLPTPILIDGTQEIWFGVVYNMVAGYPVYTIDNGGPDFIAGKTDLMYYPAAGLWLPGSALITGAPQYGWYLAGYTRDPLPTETCTVTVEMTDDWGDGWNQGYISFVDQNGIEWDVVTMNFDMGTNIATVVLPANLTINCYWNAGLYDDEVGFVIKDVNGTVLYNCATGALDGQPGLFTSFVNDACGTPPIPTDCDDYPVVGGNTGTNYTLPINTFYSYSYTQQIYDEAEIGATGDITSISFQYIFATGQNNKPNQSVYIGHTTKDVFAGNTDWVPFDDLTLVYSGSLDWNNSEPWFTIPFDQPFTYTGGNLVVAVLNNHGAYNTSSNFTFNIHNVTGNKALAYRKDNTPAGPIDPTDYSGWEPSRLFLYTYTNHVQFNICAGGPPPVVCDDYPVVGGNTSTNYTLPINTFYSYSYTQQIYDEAEIGATGDITSISFQYIFATGQNNKPNQSVYVGHTSKTTFASNTDWVPFDELTLVYSGSLDWNNSEPWFTIPFDQPFAYTGGNLVVAVLNNHGAYNTSSNFTFNIHNVTGNKALAYRKDNTPAGPIDPTDYSGWEPSRLFLYTYTNHVQFEICTGDPGSGDPDCPYIFTYTGNVQTVELQPGVDYTIECWGAKGGDAKNGTGGLGGYSKGTVSVTAPTTYYVYVGGKGSTVSTTTADGGWNGGGGMYGIHSSGNDGGTGGGGTDVRTSQNTTYADRIIVAGGGGGATGYNSYTGDGGVGGGTNGGDGTTNRPPSGGSEFNGKGGTQTAGGAAGGSMPAYVTAGAFGTGGNYTTSGTLGGNAGGGGWYGGGASSWGGGGGAGSGYIGGVTGGITAQPNEGAFVANPDATGNGYVKITCTGGSSNDCNPPTNLVASYTTDCKAELTWDAPAGKGMGKAPGDCDDVICGTGTSNYYDPLPGWYGWSRNIMLFEASELGQAGDITDVAFYITNINASQRPMKIYLMYTSATTLNSQYVWNDMKAQATLVYDDQTAFPTAGWQTFAITPFAYDGTQNLLVLVEGTGCTVSGGCSAQCRYTAKTESHWYLRADNNPPADGSLAGTRNSNRPNITFTICETGASGNHTYNIYRDGDATPIATVTTEYYLDEGFNTAIPHTWEVKAVCDGGAESDAAENNLPACGGTGPVICDDYIIGTGTSGTYDIPVNTYYRYSYTQQIFDESEIGDPGEIMSIAYQYFYNVSQDNKPNQSVYIGHTTKSNFASTADWIPFNELTPVFSGSLNWNNSEPWFTIPFDASFTYTGGNLVVAVLNNHGDYNTSYNNTFYYHEASDYKTLHYRVDGSTPINPATVPSATGRIINRSNVMFHICTGGGGDCNPVQNLQAAYENGCDVVLTWQPPVGKGAGKAMQKPMTVSDAEKGLAPAEITEETIQNNVPEIPESEKLTMGQAALAGGSSNTARTNPNASYMEPKDYMKGPGSEVILTTTTTTYKGTVANPFGPSIGSAGYVQCLDYINGVIYGVRWSNGSQFGTVNPTNGSFSVIHPNFHLQGSDGASIAHNPVNGLTYVFPWTGDDTEAPRFGTVDLATGNFTTIATWSNDGTHTYYAAIDMDGTCYALHNLTANFGTIDLATGNFTPTATLPGISQVNYIQDLAFDRETGELYWIAQTSSGNNYYKIDKTTGTLTNLGANTLDPMGFCTITESGDPCPAVTGVTATVAAGTQNVNIAWTAVAGATSTEVTRDGGVIATLSGTATSHTDNNVTPGSHTYCVRAIFPTGDDCIPQSVCAPAVMVSEILSGDCNAVIVGSGNTAQYYYPIVSLYNYSYTQQIFDAAELDANVGDEITALSFNYVLGTPRAFAIEIYLGNTTQSTFASTSNFISISDLTSVFDGTVTFDNSQTWFTIDVDPFVYTGDNIVIAVVNKALNTWFSGDPFLVHTTTGNKGVRYYRDASMINLTNPMDGSPSNGTGTTRNNVRFVICGGSGSVTYNVYKDGDFLGTTNSLTYTDLGTDADPHEWCVTVACDGGGESTAECVTLPGCENPCHPIENLNAEYDGDCNVLITWDPPVGKGAGKNAGKAVILYEDFESLVVGSDGVGYTPPTGWTLVDADGDGNNWYGLKNAGSPIIPGHGDNSLMTSASWIGVPLSPDNYVITPDVTGATSVDYWISAQDESYAAEHYALCASSTGTAPSDFTIVFEETLTSKDSKDKARGESKQGNWYNRTVNLPAGTKYIAWRHFASYDWFRINLDDITVYGEGGDPPPPAEGAYNVYRDDVLIGITDDEFFIDTEAGAEYTDHEWCVTVNCGGGTGPGTGVSGTLTTQYHANNGSGANYFDLVAGPQKVTVDALDISFTNAGNAEIHFYYREGTVCGHGDSNAGWTYMGISNVTVVVTGNGNYTYVPLPETLTIPAGETRGLYVATFGDVPGRVRYYGTAVTPCGSTPTPIQGTNDDLSLLGGYGVSAPAAPFTGTLNAERHFAGTVYYTVGGKSVGKDGKAEGTLASPYDNGAAQGGGVAFDMIAGAEDVTITEIEFPIGTTIGTRSIIAYYRENTACGNHQSSAGWTSIGPIDVDVTTPIPALTSVPLPTPITIPAGETYGFYFGVLNAGFEGIRYNGNSSTVCAATTVATNSDLTIKGGIGLQTISAPFSQTGNWIERNFAGVVHYSTGGVTPPEPGGVSDPVCITLPPCGDCEPPHNLIAAYDNSCNVNLTWSPPVVGLGCDDVPVGTGTTQTQGFPCNTYWNRGYSQQIFDAAELGGVPGTINSISFNYFHASPITSANQAILLGNTTQSTFAGETQWIPANQLQQVFAGTVNYSNANGGWTTITFDTPFEYTGDNLVVAYVNNKGSNDGSAARFNLHSAPNKGITYYYDSGPVIDPANPPTSGGFNTNTLLYRNNVIFNICSGEEVEALYNIYRDGVRIESEYPDLAYTDYGNNMNTGHTWMVKAICDIISGGSGAPGSITTQPGANYGGAIAFDIIAGAEDITLTEIQTYFYDAGVATVHVYYREGTACGFINNPTGWNYVGNTEVTVPAPGGTYTLAPFFNVPGTITIPAGETYGIYIATFGATSGRVCYYNGGGTCGVLTVSNSDLTIKGGQAATTPLDPFGGSMFQERCFAGTINYTVGGGITYSESAPIKATLEECTICMWPKNLEVTYDEDCICATVTWDKPGQGAKNGGKAMTATVEPTIPEGAEVVSQERTSQGEVEVSTLLDNSGIYTGAPYVMSDLSRGDYIYGVQAYYGMPQEHVKISLASPGQGTTQSPFYMGTLGGEYYDGYYYCSSDDGNFYKVDHNTGAYTILINHGAYFNDMTYDYANNIMYGLRTNTTTVTSTIYSVDLNSGAATLVSTLSGMSGSGFITIACNISGDMYGITLDGSGATLYSINLSASTCTSIGGTGLTSNFAQGSTFDHETGTYYWCNYRGSGASNLCIVNVSTGTATPVNSNAIGEVCGAYIPFVANQDVAKAPNPFTVVPVGTSLKANLAWTNPSETLAGDPLTTINSIVIKRDGTQIHEITTGVTPGAPMTWQDAAVPSVGEHCYTVYATTSEGNGVSAGDCGIFGNVCMAEVIVLQSGYGDEWSWKLTDDDTNDIIVAGGSQGNGSYVSVGTFPAMLTGNATFELWSHGVYYGDNTAEVRVKVNGDEVYYSGVINITSNGITSVGEVPCSSPVFYNVYFDGVLIAGEISDNFLVDCGILLPCDWSWGWHLWEVTAICDDGVESEPASLLKEGCTGDCQAPTNLQGEYTGVDCNALLTWDAPEPCGKGTKSNLQPLNHDLSTMGFGTGKPQVEVSTLLDNTGVYTGAPYVMSDLSRGDYIYGVQAYYGMPQEHVKISLANPGQGTTQSPFYMGTLGGEYYDGYYYCSSEDGNFYKVDHNTGAYTVLINHGAYFNDMTYDYANNIMYGLRTNTTTVTSTIYSVDLNSGAATLVSTLTGMSGSGFITIACNVSGDMYGITLDGSGATLYSINLSASTCTSIGGTGLTSNFAQGSTFDHETGIYYWCNYRGSGASNLCIVNVSTGTATPVNSNAIGEICGAYIPFVANQDVAKAPAPFNVTAMGTSLKAKVTWTNPTETLAGDPLPSTFDLVLLRDGNPIETFTGVGSGQNMSYTDNEVPSAGNHCYSAYAVTSEGNGVSASDCDLFGNMCSIRFEKYDDYGDGWNGGNITVEIDGNTVATVGLTNGNYATETLSIPAGELKLYWNAGSWDEEVSFEVYDAEDELIYVSPNGMSGMAGLLYTGDLSCGISYNIYRDGVLIAAGWGDTEYLDDELDCTLEHTWYVTVACSPEGESGPTNELWLRSCCVCDPIDPCGYEPQQPKEGVVEFTWDAPDIPGYLGVKITRDGIIIAPLVTDMHHTDYVSVGNHVYCFTALYLKPECTESEATCCTVYVYPQCDPVENVTATIIGPAKVRVEWMPVEAYGLVDYTIFRDGETTALGNTTATFYIDEPVEVGPHFYSVVANYHKLAPTEYNCTESEPTESNEIVIEPCIAIDPTTLEVTETATDHITITWDYDLTTYPGTTFDIYRDFVLIDNTDELTYTDEGTFAENVVYQYCVTPAYETCQVTPACVDAYIPPCVPLDVTDLELEGNYDAKTVTLTWTYAGTDATYTILRNNKELVTGITAKTYTDETIEYDVVYKYCVVPVADCPGGGMACNTIVVNGVNINELDGISVYPNPASTAVTIKGAEVVQLDIYNAIGQLVQTIKSVEGEYISTVDVSNYETGAYIFKLHTADKAVITKPIVVARY